MLTYLIFHISSASASPEAADYPAYLAGRAVPEDATYIGTCRGEGPHTAWQDAMDHAPAGADTVRWQIFRRPEIDVPRITEVLTRRYTGVRSTLKCCCGAINQPGVFSRIECDPQSYGGGCWDFKVCFAVDPDVQVPHPGPWCGSPWPSQAAFLAFLASPETAPLSYISS